MVCIIQLMKEIATFVNFSDILKYIYPQLNTHNSKINNLKLYNKKFLTAYMNQKKLQQKSQQKSQQQSLQPKFPLIQQSSDTWNLLQFKLQLSVGTIAATITNIYDISDSHTRALFNTYSMGKTVIESFVQTQKFIDQKDQKSLQKFIYKVRQKGFDVGQKGMTFDVGYNAKIDARLQKDFTIFMCKIAVGKSYCSSQKKFKQQPKAPPDGFDSIYLYNNDQNLQVLINKYILFHNQQVYPCYFIKFTIDPNRQQQFRAHQCGNCSIVPPNQAKVYCIDDQQYFCMDCDKDYHAQKILNNHSKVPTTQKIKKFGHCPMHNDQKLALYCSICYKALCLICKVSGDHSSNRMALHQLTKLKDAYSDISTKVKQIDPNIERKKNQLNEDINKIDLKIKEVNNNVAHVEQQIHEHHLKALAELENQAHEKLSILIGDQLELKRQYDHIQWMEGFVKYALQVEEAYEFLDTWHKYSKYKLQVLNLTNLPINTQVKADIRMQGSVHVISEFRKKHIQQSEKKNGFGEMREQREQRQQRMPMVQSTPVKVKQIKPTEQIGSTQLRKTVFKKHCPGKVRESVDTG